MATKNSTNGNGTTVTAAAALPQPEIHFTEAPASVNLRFNYRGYNGIQLTLRGNTGLEVLGKLDGALNKLEGLGATPATGTPPRNADSGNGSAPMCPTHGTPMKPSKRGGGWYCTQKVAETGGGDDGSKPIYCKATVK
jgi:hypothetical protein